MLVFLFERRRKRREFLANQRRCCRKAGYSACVIKPLFHCRKLKRCSCNLSKCSVRSDPACSVLQVQQCHYDPAHRAANCSQYRFLTQGDEGNLQAAVASIGPISVAIDAKQPKFAFYKSGGFSASRVGGVTGD